MVDDYKPGKLYRTTRSLTLFKTQDQYNHSAFNPIIELGVIPAKSLVMVVASNNAVNHVNIKVVYKDLVGWIQVPGTGY